MFLLPLELWFPQTFVWSKVIFMRQIYGSGAKFWSVGNEHFDVITATADLSAKLSNHNSMRMRYKKLSKTLNQIRKLNTKNDTDKSVKTGSKFKQTSRFLKRYKSQHWEAKIYQIQCFPFLLLLLHCCFLWNFLCCFHCLFLCLFFALFFVVVIVVLIDQIEVVIITVLIKGNLILSGRRCLGENLRLV